MTTHKEQMLKATYNIICKPDTCFFCRNWSWDQNHSLLVVPAEGKLGSHCVEQVRNYANLASLAHFAVGFASG